MPSSLHFSVGILHSNMIGCLKPTQNNPSCWAGEIRCSPKAFLGKRKKFFAEILASSALSASLFQNWRAGLQWFLDTPPSHPDLGRLRQPTLMDRQCLLRRDSMEGSMWTAVLVLPVMLL